jgi:hypothetical protein
MRGVPRYRCIGFEKFSVFCGGPEKAQYWRERWFSFSASRNRHPRMVTRGPGPPCQGPGYWFRRRQRAGGGVLLTQPTGLLLFGGGEETHHRRWWHAPHAAVCLLRTWRPMPKEYDSWARAPVPETRSPWRASGEVFYGALGRKWGNPSLKRDSSKRGSHSHQRPFALELFALLCRRSRHGPARPSRAPPARGSTQLGVQPAWMGWVGVCRKDPCRCISSRRPRRRRVCVLRLQTPQRVGATDLVFLRAAARGALPRGGGALPPVLSFKDVHQPCSGGEQAGLRLRLPHELVTRLFLQHSEERMVEREVCPWAISMNFGD